MSNLTKNKLSDDLQKIKSEGQIRSERIREIIRSAVHQATSEVKAGTEEVRGVVQEAIATVIEVFQERGGSLKEEVTASIQGAIEGISDTKKQTISQNQTQLDQLQQTIDIDEQLLNEQVEIILKDVEETNQDKPEQIKAAVREAISSLKDTEEMALMQKRYAQLKAQLAVVQANLASRYGERYEDVKRHLDDAKVWYDRAKVEGQVFAEQAEVKQQELDQKFGQVGGAIARKERHVKQLLKELWITISEVFHSKSSSHKP